MLTLDRRWPFGRKDFYIFFFTPKCCKPRIYSRSKKKKKKRFNGKRLSSSDNVDHTCALRVSVRKEIKKKMQAIYLNRRQGN